MQCVRNIRNTISLSLITEPVPSRCCRRHDSMACQGQDGQCWLVRWVIIWICNHWCIVETWYMMEVVTFLSYLQVPTWSWWCVPFTCQHWKAWRAPCPGITEFLYQPLKAVRDVLVLEYYDQNPNSLTFLFTGQGVCVHCQFRQPGSDCWSQYPKSSFCWFHFQALSCFGFKLLLWS